MTVPVSSLATPRIVDVNSVAIRDAAIAAINNTLFAIHGLTVHISSKKHGVHLIC